MVHVVVSFNSSNMEPGIDKARCCTLRTKAAYSKTPLSTIGPIVVSQRAHDLVVAI